MLFHSMVVSASPAKSSAGSRFGMSGLPGMVEAHTHFGWTNSTTLDAIQKLPH